MKTLTLREKVFISLVTAAAIAALIVFWYPSSSTGAADRSKRLTAELNDFSSKLAIQVARNGISPFEAAAIAKAVEPWKKDPFLKLKRQHQVVEDQSSKSSDRVDAVNLSYSGYLQMGTRKLAIINGMEYEAGERLVDRPALSLQRISSDMVVLVQTDTGAKIVVPIERDSSQAGTTVPPEYLTRRRILTGIKAGSGPGQTDTHTQRSGIRTRYNGKSL